MKYYLFFDGSLFEIEEEAKEIINFCRQKPIAQDTKNLFKGVELFDLLISESVIFESEGVFSVADGVKIFEDSQFVLTAITFYFGFQCNLNCHHCHSRLLAKNKEEQMNDEQASFIVREIVKAKPFSVRLGGGEPLMRKDFLITIDKLTSSSIVTSFTTNGWYLDNKMVKSLVDFKNLDPVRLSIHGIGDSHDIFTRAKGSYTRLMRAQKLLRDAGLKHKFVVVICSQTKDNIDNLITLAEDVGASGILFRALKQSGNATQDQFISPEEWRAAYAFIQNRAKRSKIKIEFAPSGPPVTRYIGLEEECLCGRNMLTIRPSGDFSACGIAFKTVGNVFTDSLVDAWQNNPEFLKIRRGFCPCEAMQI